MFLWLIAVFTLLVGGVSYEIPTATQVDVAVVEQVQEGLAELSPFGRLVVLSTVKEIVGVYDDWPHCGGAYPDRGVIVLNQNCEPESWGRLLAHETAHLLWTGGWTGYERFRENAFAIRMEDVLTGGVSMNVTMLEKW